MTKNLCLFFVFLLCFFVSGVVYAQQYGLSILQVHIDGTDERIEIHNNSQNIFSGNIMISGIHSSDKFFSIFLDPGVSMLLGDKGSAYTGSVPEGSILGAGFVIKDTPDTFPHRIAMSMSGEVLTEIFLDEDILEKHNEIKTPIIIHASGNISVSNPDSTPPLEEDDILEEETIAGSGVNILEESIISTGSIIYTGTDITEFVLTGSSVSTGSGALDEENNDSEVQSGATILLENNQETVDIAEIDTSTLPGISLIEVYPYDTDYFAEYLLLEYTTDISDPYMIYGIGRGGTSGKIIDNCPGSAGSLILLTDSVDLFIEHDSYILCPLSSISLTDTGQSLRIETSLGSVLSEASYTPSGSVSKQFAFDLATSERVIPLPVSTLLDTKIADYMISCSLNILYGEKHIEIDLDEGFCDKEGISHSRSVIQNGEEQVFDSCHISLESSLGSFSIDHKTTRLDGSGTVFCSNSFDFDMEGIDEEQAIENINNAYTGSALYISEIYPFDTELYNEYIELFAAQDYSGEITFLGLGSGETLKNITIDLKKGQSLVLSENDIPHTYSLIVPGISLLNAGEEIILTGQDGQQIDKVSYLPGSSDFALYFSTVSEDTRIFETKDIPTLGYISGLGVNVCPALHIPECHILLQGSKSLYSKNKVNLAVHVDNRLLSNTNQSYYCSRYGETIPDDFDTGDCNPSSTHFDSGGLHELEVEVFRDGAYFCRSEYILNLPETKTIESKEILCVSDQDTVAKTSSNVILETFVTDIEMVSEELLAQPYLDIRDDILVMKRLLPNPSGKDGGAEGIVLSNISGETINLEEIFLDNGKKKTPLYGTILPGEELTVYQTLGLYNSASCVRLWENNEIILGEICYPKAKDDIWYHPSVHTISSLSDTDRYGKLLLKEIDNDICVIYDDEPILCKKQIITIQELKTLKNEFSTSKKDLKKIVSLEKKATRAATSLEKKLVTSIERLEKEKIKRKDDKAKYTLTLADIKQEKRESDILAQLHKEFIYESVDRLRGPWKPIYEETEIDSLYTQRRDIQKEFTSGKESFAYGSVIVPREDLVLAYKIRTQTVDLTDMPITELYGPALRDIRDRIQVFKNKLYSASGDDTLSFADDFPGYAYK